MVYWKKREIKLERHISDIHNLRDHLLELEPLCFAYTK